MQVRRQTRNGLGGEVQMKYSKPFKKNGTLHRWRFQNTHKILQYFHRKAGKWLDSKDADKQRIVKEWRHHNG